MEEALKKALGCIEKLATALHKLQEENEALRKGLDVDNGYVDIIYGGEVVKCYVADIDSSYVSSEAYRDVDGRLHALPRKAKRCFRFIEI